MTETPTPPDQPDQPIDPSLIDTSSELSALVRQAVLEALQSGGASLLAPAPQAIVEPLAATITPKLGLSKPALDDPADIQVLNGNFDILDNSVTATQVVTLTNKTLDAPIINNPTITGWTNAQHTHLNAAGGGGLDGLAIVSGYNGTGNLLRETGTFFTDPLVRDTIQWGAKPSGAADTTLQRTGAGRLRLQPTGATATPAVYEARLGGTTSTGFARFGQFATDGLWLSNNAS